MVLVDLSNSDAEWLFKHISAIVEMNPKLPVFGFSESQIPTAVRDRAERYGCRLIFLKPELLEELPNLLTKALSGGF